MSSWLSAIVCPGEYQSVKFVRVKNKALAALHRLIFLSILAYVVVFQLFVEKGYQATDSFSGSPDIKVKGVAVSSDGSVVDAVDLIHPALEESAIFIQTNSFETKGQRQGLCSGVDRRGLPPAQVTEVCECGDNLDDCPNGYCVPNVPTANGITTGRCINTNDERNYDRQLITTSGLGWMCEVKTWCPVENEKGADEQAQDGANLIPQVGNFTIFARIDGRFPRLAPNKTFSNFHSNKLVWNQNLFYLSDLVAAATTQEKLPVLPLDSNKQPLRPSQQYFNAILRKGAEIVVDFVWDCDLDGSEENCKTEVKISRIDRGKGFNFRSAKNYLDPENPLVEKRDLVKHYGLRIVFRVVGQGGKFDAVELGMVLGSGLGLLGVATVVADVLLYASKRTAIYMRAKYEEVREGVRNDPTSLDSSDHTETLLPTAAT